MKKITFLLVTLLLAALSFAQEQKTDVAATDAVSGQPLTFSGTIQCDEIVNGGNIAQKFNGNISGKNVSGKEILLYVVRFDPVCFRQGIAPQQYQHDWFFKEHGILDGESVPFPLELDSDHDGVNPNVAVSSLPATVLYVQFADGSEYGNHDAGMFNRNQRSEVEAYLRQLVAADQAGFVRLLNEKKDPQKSSIWAVNEHVKMLFQAQGWKDTQRVIRERLAVIQTRAALK